MIVKDTLCFPRPGQEARFRERLAVWGEAMARAGCLVDCVAGREAEVRWYTLWPAFEALQEFMKGPSVELTRKAPTAALCLRMQVRHADVLAPFAAAAPAPALLLKAHVLKDGARPEATRRLKARGQMLARAAGFVSGELAADRADPRRLVMAARFQGREAMEMWRTLGERAADSEHALGELVENVELAEYA